MDSLHWPSLLPTNIELPLDPTHLGWKSGCQADSYCPWITKLPIIISPITNVNYILFFFCLAPRSWANQCSLYLANNGRLCLIQCVGASIYITRTLKETSAQVRSCSRRSWNNAITRTPTVLSNLQWKIRGSFLFEPPWLQPEDAYYHELWMLLYGHKPQVCIKKWTHPGVI